MLKCCICGQTMLDHGNNPFPIKSEGRCCDSCNRKFVIPMRFIQLAVNKRSDGLSNKEGKEDKNDDR